MFQIYVKYMIEFVTPDVTRNLHMDSKKIPKFYNGYKPPPVAAFSFGPRTVSLSVKGPWDNDILR